MSFLDVDGLCKSYGGREILHGVGLEIEKGEVLGIIGPNGAGKSTLLRLVNLVERPDSGRILFSGADVQDVCESLLLKMRRRIGAVLQSPLLFRGSVEYNVEYGLRVRGMGKGNAVSYALKKVGLAGFEGRDVLTLSGGECQRVALARAIAFGPDLLLLDEPTADVDPENAGSIEKAVLRMGKKTAVVLSTHDLAQAKRITDRAAFMDSGRILECMRTRALFKSPEDPRTIDFLGGALGF